MPRLPGMAPAPLALLIACLLACGITGSASAQQSDTVRLRGTVQSAEGEPVAGALVRFIRLDGPDTIPRGTITSPSGEFAITLPAGRYRWQVGRMGLTARDGEVQVAPGEMVMIVMEPRVVALGPILPGASASKFFNLSDVNYFSTGFDGRDENRPDRQSASQIKFRIALRYKIVNLLRTACDSCRSGLYVTYAQTSFWHFYDPSAPFFDNNYSPGGIVYLALGGDGPDFRGLAIFGGVLHESNGRDLPSSRGWQRTVVGASLGAVNQSPVSGTLTLWNPWDLEDTNPDLADYAGRGELTVFYQPWANEGDPGPLTVQLRSRLFGSRAVSNVELNVMGDLPVIGRWLTPHLFAQVFHGYAENLLTYNEKRTVVRVGLGLLR